MKYTAINIGPIVSTLGMARKPRELWAASYMFSHLMKCVFEVIGKTESIKVFSPKLDETEEKIGVGLYPDRVYCTGSLDFEANRTKILNKFCENLGMSDNEGFKDYFNIMCATIDVEDGWKETQAITELNHLLDCLELQNKAVSEASRNSVWSFITKAKTQKKLFELAFPYGNFAMGYRTLAEYASIQFTSTNFNTKKWQEAGNVANLFDKLREESPSTFIEGMEDAFYRKLKESFPDDIKSYHKYFCLVQADGDNMGKTFSHNSLGNNQTAVISQKLVQFGKDASQAIYDYGGLPIYAGGDDLLFLAPVVGKNTVEDNHKHRPKNIFDLLKDIDTKFDPVKQEVCARGLFDEDSNKIIPSMSYGVSITYYKYPLYEALHSAQYLLFDVAKQTKGKNVIAWRLQKNSGSSFSGTFSKTDLLKPFENLIKSSSVKDTLISAVSHKIRENQDMLKLWLKTEETYENRNLHFFEKYMDYNGKDEYKKSVLQLLNKLYAVYLPLIENNDSKVETDNDVKILPSDKAKGIFTIDQKKEYLKQSKRNDLFKMAYGMIRTAKFINGEEVKDE